MATLNETMVDIADAIREKTGKSELIKPIDFAEEIKGITAGGGGTPDTPSGSSWRFFDTSQAKVTDTLMWLDIVAYIFPYFKISGRNGLIIGGFTSFGTNTDIKAVAVNLISKRLHPNYTGGKLMTVEDMIATMGGFEELCLQWGFTEITKEQFYDLNA